MQYYAHGGSGCRCGETCSDSNHSDFLPGKCRNHFVGSACIRDEHIYVLDRADQSGGDPPELAGLSHHSFVVVPRPGSIPETLRNTLSRKISPMKLMAAAPIRENDQGQRT